MDFTQILLISYLALFKWSSNYLSDNYFFLFDKIKQKKLLYNTHTFFHPFFYFIPADFHRFCNLIDRKPRLSQRKRCFLWLSLICLQLHQLQYQLQHRLHTLPYEVSAPPLLCCTQKYSGNHLRTICSQNFFQNDF